MATITALKAELDQYGIQYPAKASKAELSAMLEFLNDDDDDDGPAVPAMDVSVDTGSDTDSDSGTEPDAGMGQAPAPAPAAGMVDTSGLSDADADRLAEILGDQMADDDDDDDRGAGDLAGDYVEAFNNYHQTTLDQAPGGDIQRVVAPTIAAAITKAQAQGRRVIGLPVIAHNYPATGNDRRQIVVQVPVAPIRRTTASRRRALR